MFLLRCNPCRTAPFNPTAAIQCVLATDWIFPLLPYNTFP